MLLTGKQCEHEGCTKQPSYGKAGPGEKAWFCKAHAEEGMVPPPKKSHT